MSVNAEAPPQAPSDVQDVQLEYRGVGRSFRSKGDLHVAVTDIDLEISRGEFVCLVGPSGCGKSTLLNMAAGLLTPTVGEVRYDGHAVDRVNTQVGYVTQKDSLLQWRTVERNISLPLEVQRVPKAERRQRVDEMLELVGLTRFADRYPSELSGGMRKRVLLAQTLAYRPDTLLMDEPFGALDAQLRMTLQQDLLDIWTKSAKTVVFVTHDLEEAILLGDRVVVFSASPGRIIHDERIALPRPRDLVSLRSNATFRETWERLWGLLAQERRPEDV